VRKLLELKPLVPALDRQNRWACDSIDVPIKMVVKTNSVITTRLRNNLLDSIDTFTLASSNLLVAFSYLRWSGLMLLLLRVLLKKGHMFSSQAI